MVTSSKVAYISFGWWVHTISLWTLKINQTSNLQISEWVQVWINIQWSNPSGGFSKVLQVPDTIETHNSQMEMTVNERWTEFHSVALLNTLTLIRIVNTWITSEQSDWFGNGHGGNGTKCIPLHLRSTSSRGKLLPRCYFRPPSFVRCILQISRILHAREITVNILF